MKVKSRGFLNLFFFQKGKCGEQKEKGVTLTGGSRNGGDVRVGGGGRGVEMQRGRRRTHVEDITVRVKAQSLFMVHFVRGRRCSERLSDRSGCGKDGGSVEAPELQKQRSSSEAEARAPLWCPPTGPDNAACHFTLHPGLHLS